MLYPRALPLAAALVLVFAGACASTAPAPSRPTVAPPPRVEPLPAEVAACLVDPASGFAGEVPPATRAELLAAHRGVVAERRFAEAQAWARERLAADPAFTPARVLSAQASVGRGDDGAAIAELLSVVDAVPGYTAAQLALGCAAERAGDAALAYAAFRAVAAKSPVAFERTGRLHAQAIAIVRERLDAALERADRAAAEAQLRFLREWGPSELATLEATADFARAVGDRRLELSAVRGLAERNPEDRPLLERRIDLELEVGDPSAALDIAERLAAQHASDPAALERLESTQFRWRLSFLPADVRALAASPTLSRADYAVLLFWLVPDVRYAKPAAGLIATDVLDQPRQEEIVRVVNLGLMDVDRTLHRFGPEAELRRQSAFAALVRLIEKFGDDRACVQGDTASPCATAARCGLLAAVDDCRARDAVAGGDAVEMIRRALARLDRATRRGR